MKNKLKLFGIAALIFSAVIFVFLNQEQNFHQENDNVVSSEELASVPEFSDWATHHKQEGLVERRIGTCEFTDQEKTGPDSFDFFLSNTFQKHPCSVLSEKTTDSGCFIQGDFPVLYHNLRI